MLLNTGHRCRHDPHMAPPLVSHPEPGPSVPAGDPGDRAMKLWIESWIGGIALALLFAAVCVVV